MEAYHRTRKDGAVGVDGVTGEEYAQSLEQNLEQQTQQMGGCWLLEVDIRKFFDTLDHRCMREILEQRVRDGVVRRLLDKQTRRIWCKWLRRRTRGNNGMTWERFHVLTTSCFRLAGPRIVHSTA